MLAVFLDYLSEENGANENLQQAMRSSLGKNANFHDK